MSKAMEKKNMEGKILTALKEANNPRGLYLKEIHEITGLSPNTIAKYVLALEYKELVTVDTTIGNAKLVCLNKSPVEKRGRGS